MCSGATSATKALELAYDEIKAINEPGTLNAIVFFTDGQPNALQSSSTNPFPIKTEPDSRDDWYYGASEIQIPQSSCAPPIP